MAGSVGDGEFGFQIAPMLDVLFVLLLFFMVSAGAQKHEASISTQLPGGQPTKDTLIPIRVSMDMDGEVSANDAPLDTPTSSDLPDVTKRLEGIVANNPTQPIIITPSPS